MRYGSVARKLFKIRWGLHNKGLIEDHHVIPTQFKNHSMVMKSGYDIHASTNVVILPTRHGKHVLRVREDRLIHEGNHPAYNAYVGHMLNAFTHVDDFDAFVIFLKRACRYEPHTIPW
jgi:hypothetical protein